MNPMVQTWRYIKAIAARWKVLHACSKRVPQLHAILRLIAEHGPVVVKGRIGQRVLQETWKHPDTLIAGKTALALFAAGVVLPKEAVFFGAPTEAVALHMIAGGVEIKCSDLKSWCHRGWGQALEQGLVSNPSAWPKNGLAWAVCCRAPVASIVILLEKGISPNNPDCHGVPALHWAASFGNKEMVDVLRAGGADPHVLSGGGRTALEFARARAEEWGDKPMEERYKAGVPKGDNLVLVELIAEDLDEALPSALTSVITRRRM